VRTIVVMPKAKPVQIGTPDQIRCRDAPSDACPAPKKEQANKSLAKEAKEELARLS